MTTLHWPQTEFTQKIRNTVPLIQAPMAGGATTPELVAAVCNSGAIGSLAGGLLHPDELKKAIRNIRDLTRKPFCVNLFTPATPHQTISTQFLEKLKEFEREAGFSVPMEIHPSPNFEKQAAVLLEEEVPIFSFTFGIPSLALLKDFHRRGTTVLGTATHLKEALALQEAGVDFIICQGKEAGGHRGTFMGPYNEGLIPTLELVRQIKEKVKKALIASGGIMQGSDIRAALQAGASAVQMGTAFLLCPECGIDPNYKRALLVGKNKKTVLTNAYSGKWARCIENRFIREMSALEEIVPPYPIAQSLTDPLRKAALAANHSDFMCLYAGEHFARAESMPAQELIARLTLELQ